MGTFIFKSPKDPQQFREMLDKGKIDIIRDNLIIHRTFIIQHDGIRSKDNGCKAHVVKVYSRKHHDYDIIVVGHKWLDFHTLSVNFEGLIPRLITKQEDITNYLTK